MRTWTGAEMVENDNRIFSEDACIVCGRLGDPHAEWCSVTRQWLDHVMRSLGYRP